MIIPFLEALLPSAVATTAPNGNDPAAAGVFEALLAGIGSEKAVLPAEQPLAVPGEAKPPISQASLKSAMLPALSGAALPTTGNLLPTAAYGPSEGRLSDTAIETASPLTEDRPEPLPRVSEAPSAQPSGEESVALFPVATVVLATAPIPVPVAEAVPVTLAMTARLSATNVNNAPPPPHQQAAVVPDSTQQKAVVVLPTIAEGEQSAPPVGTSVPAAPPSVSPPPAGTASVPNATEVAKPVHSFTPSLTVFPSAAPLAATGFAPTPPKKAPESMFGPAALPVSFEVPSTIVAAPVPLQPVVALGEAGPAGSQAPTQPITLPDHRALVEALVRARTERDPGVSVALETREFGAVALRFDTLQSITGERGLQVGLSSNDPGFERAVASAAAAQAALTDQSARTPASRGDAVPARSADPFANPVGDSTGGRNTSSDQQSQHRSGQTETFRDPRSLRSLELPPPADEPLATAHPDRRRGSIFA